MKRDNKSDDRLKTIGKRLRKNRRSKHYSQEEVAESLGVNHATISRYENGIIDIPVSALLKIGNLCGFEPKNCFTWESDGLDELQRLLEDCNKETATVNDRKQSLKKIVLSEETKDLLMAYEVLQSNPSIPKDTIKTVKEDIIVHVEIEQGAKREELLGRLKEYSRIIREMT